MSSRRFGLFVGMAILLLALGVLPAAADQFYLTSDHCTGGCGTPPFGLVTLTQDGNDVKVEVTLSGSNLFVTTGASGGEVFQFVGLLDNNSVYSGGITNGAIMSLSGGTASWGIVSLVANGPANYGQGGVGFFAFGISCSTCKNGLAYAFAGPIDFTVTNATLAQLEVANGLGNYFVADIYSPTGNNGVGATGLVDASAPVPEPVAMVLMGTFLSLAGGLLGKNKLMS
jgi:hypothetical protein